jgi:hypothetical protein
MLRVLAICAALSIPAGPAFAQEQPPPKKDDPAKPLVYKGVVRSLEIGKVINIESGGVTHSYDLTRKDVTYRISSDVKAGSDVKVTEAPDITGKKSVTIELAAVPTAR